MVLQLAQPRAQIKRVEDLPWSQGYVYEAQTGQSLNLNLFVYNFAMDETRVRMQIESAPTDWEVTLPEDSFLLAPGERRAFFSQLTIPVNSAEREGWVTVRADCGASGQPVLAFRVSVASP